MCLQSVFPKRRGNNFKCTSSQNSCGCVFYLTWCHCSCTFSGRNENPLFRYLLWKMPSGLLGFAANSSAVSPLLRTLSANVTPDVAEVAFGALLSCRITAFSKDLSKDKHQPTWPQEYKCLLFSIGRWKETDNTWNVSGRRSGVLGKGEGPTERSCVRRTWPCCFDKWTRWNARGIFSGSFFDMLKLPLPVLCMYEVPLWNVKCLTFIEGTCTDSDSAVTAVHLVLAITTPSPTTQQFLCERVNSELPADRVRMCSFAFH